MAAVSAAAEALLDRADGCGGLAPGAAGAALARFGPETGHLVGDAVRDAVARDRPQSAVPLLAGARAGLSFAEDRAHTPVVR